MFFGWKVKFKNSNVKLQFLNSSRKICISAHTTPFIDGILIHLALDYINIPHLIYSKYLFIFTPKWCRDINSFSGFIENETKILKNEKTFCRVIFPSGGKIKWKSGFYYLAKETEADIFIIGIDYKLKKVVIDSKLQIDTFENTKNEAKKSLLKYTPGPLWYFLRKFIGYGCETYDLDYEYDK